MMRLVFKILITFLLAGISILSASAAPDQVVINSGDWQDVYLGTYYAGFSDINSKFIISSEHSSFFFKCLIKTRKIYYLSSPIKHHSFSTSEPALKGPFYSGRNTCFRDST